MNPAEIATNIMTTLKDVDSNTVDTSLAIVKLLLSHRELFTRELVVSDVVTEVPEG